MKEERGYQYGYSALHPEATAGLSRERKARTAIAVLRAHLGRDLAGLRVLDVGASSGTMADCLASEGCEVDAIDIDAPAIESAQQRFAHSGARFTVGDAQQLGFPDASMDIVLCCHVYEHVPDAPRMMREIRRVLKPGGICYFAAGNRLAWREPHYGLPLLSVIPRPLAHLYLRMLGRGTHYHEKHLGLRGLRKLCGAFELKDYTRAIIDDPERFGAGYMLRAGSLKQRLAALLVRVAPWSCPSYIWILRKLGSSR